MWLFLLAVMCVVLAGSGCSNNADPVGGDTTASATVQTSIAGVVQIGADIPVADAVVTAYGRTTTTDSRGFFIIPDVTVPKDRCVVGITSHLKLPAYKAQVPVEGGVTRMIIHIGEVVKIFEADKAGWVIDPPSGPYIAPDAIVTDDGTLYEGTVRIADNQRLDPHRDFPFGFLELPGDYTGVRTDGSRTYLLSYGYKQTRISTPDGAPLRLDSGKTATICFPVDRRRPDLPAELPLWLFDEEDMIWKEKGTAALGDMGYTASVPHFGDWMAALPVPSATLKGHVSCGGVPAPGVLVRAGQQLVLTDANGNYSVPVPSGNAAEVFVDGAWNNGAAMAAPVQIGPPAAGGTEVYNIELESCAAYVTGTLVGCNGGSAAGVVHAKGPHVYNSDYNFAVARGGFVLRVQPNTPLAITVNGDGGVQSRINIQSVAPGAVFDAGEINQCDQTVSAAFDLDLGKGEGLAAAFSYDDSKIAVTGEYGTYLVDMGTRVVDRRLSSVNYTSVDFQGPYLVATTDDPNRRGGRLWNASTWQEAGSVGGGVISCVVRDHETVFAILPMFGTIVQRRIGSDAEVARLSLGGIEPYRLLRVLDGREVCYTTSIEGTNAHRIMFGNVFNPYPGREIALPYHAQHRRATLSYDGSIIAVPTSERLQFYDVGTTKLLSAISLSHKGHPVVFAFTHDGTAVALQHADYDRPQVPGVYGIAAGNRTATLEMPGESTRFTAFACSRDGRYVAGLYREGEQGKMRVWRLR